MKARLVALVATLALSPVATSFVSAQTPRLLLPGQHAIQPGPQVLVPGVRACVDLGVDMSVNAAHDRDGQSTFTVTLTNTSSINFVSSNGLQWVDVSITSAFGATEAVQLPFTQLNAGQSRTWSVARQGSGWQGQASLYMSPITRTDGNLRNNECNGGNNSDSAAV
ncbi:hypothetical protein [Pararhodobacter sp. CCB-MM2]|uniref:hypothetical protein n=1 Tax=Pararhodobacter sp. CCB-MM2 TaxID=1786003 RepID=UPI0008325991|nr:hypothetical protein [Pararhodobacter sp. CCB-MM2]